MNIIKQLPLVFGLAVGPFAWVGVVAADETINTNGNSWNIEEEISRIYRPTDEDYVDYPSQSGSLRIASSFTHDPVMAAGKARFVEMDPEAEGTIYTYSEVIYVTSGKARISRSVPPYDKEQIHEINAGDYLYIPETTKVKFLPDGDAPLEILFVITNHPDQ